MLLMLLGSNQVVSDILVGWCQGVLTLARTMGRVGSVSVMDLHGI